MKNLVVIILLAMNVWAIVSLAILFERAREQRKWIVLVFMWVTGIIVARTIVALLLTLFGASA